MSEERIDVIDEHGTVIGTAARSEVRSRGLLHRVARVVIENSQGKLLAQKRAMGKDIYPGAWDIGIAETLTHGEGYEDAAVRGLNEEFGIPPNIEHIFDERYRSEKHNVNYKVFRQVWDGSIERDLNEIEESGYLTVSEMNDLMKQKRLSPGAEVTFKAYLKWKKRLKGVTWK